MLKKINQMAKAILPQNKENILYIKYSKQFDYFLNSNAIRESLIEINKYHIPDTEIEKKLKELLIQPMDFITAFVGYKGIGKTTDIKYIYQLSNSTIHLDKSHKTIFFPVFCKNFLTEHISYEYVLSDLAKRISATCSQLEEDEPRLKEFYCSKIGKEKFIKFIKDTNRKNLESFEMENKSDEEKLDYMKEVSPFVYFVSKLKYYLTNDLCKHNRFFIILDNIESIPFDELKVFLLQYFKFFDCVKNLPNEKYQKPIYINMLLALRPDTYKAINMDCALSSFRIAKIITKTRSVDLAKYFERKYNLLPSEIRKKEEDKWDEAYKVLILLSEKFDKKYSKMIKHLSFLNISDSLMVYKKILNNFTWTISYINEECSYVFNNITVIRAIACGNNLVYCNDNYIPNIFLEPNLESPYYMLFSLYIIKYFLVYKAEYRDYGQQIFIKKEKLLTDFSNVFGNQYKTQLNNIITYFCDIEVLSYGISDEKACEELYISSKGYEIWNMFIGDSVLMELYREDMLRDFNSEISQLSSYELMNSNQQVEIFLDLFIILRILCLAEKEMKEIAISNQAYPKYVSMFGCDALVSHLWEGIKKSIDFSGKNGYRKIEDASFELKEEISIIEQLGVK